MRKFFFFFPVFVVLACVLAQPGCDLNPFKSGDGNAVSLPGTAGAGSANVKFQIVLPDKEKGKTLPPLAEIRPATTGTAKVTVRLVLVNPGNRTKRSETLTKTVDVNADGVAETSFEAVPAKPVVGQIKIDNGNVGGFADFHGATDLTKGDNVLELAPTGYGDPRDVVAHVVENAIQSPDLIEKVTTGMVANVKLVVNTIDLNSKTVHGDALSKFIEIVKPVSYYYFAMTDDLTSLIAYQSGVEKWRKTVSEYWKSSELWSTGISDMRINRILRQGMDGFGYVGYKHVSLSPFGILKIDTVTGSRLGYCKNPGYCDQAMVLSDGSIVVGGTHDDKRCPVLFRWDGKTTASTDSNAGGNGSGLMWVKYFTELGALSGNPAVENIQFDGIKTLIVSVRDVNGDFSKIYRIVLDTGLGDAPVPPTGGTNYPPTVSIFSPANNSSFAAGSNITITAKATDQDGTIAKVEFFQGATKLGEDSTSPYTYAWTNVPAGKYSLTAKATDNSGNAKTSSPVAINPLPGTPTNPTAAAGSSQNTIAWTAVSGVTTYNLYWSTSPGVTKANGTKVTGVTSPYTHSSLTNGTTYYYVVTAINSSGESVESSQSSATPVAAVSGILFADNFDDKTLNQVPAGWKVTYSGDGQCKVVNSSSSSSPNSFRLGCYSNWDGTYYHEFTPSGDQITVAFKFRGDPNTWFRPYFIVRVDQNGYSCGFNSTTGKINWSGVVGSSISKGTWYLVKMVINRSTKTASFYLNDTLEASNVPSNGTGITQSNQMPTTSWVMLASGNGGSGAIYYDDVKVEYSGTSTVTSIFSEDWSQGLENGKWTKFGSPSPVIVSEIFGKSNAFDGMGDPNYDSGAFTSSNLDLSGYSKVVIEADSYINFTDLGGCWNAARIALTKNPTIDNPNADRVQINWGLIFQFATVGDACWGTPAEYRRHSYFMWNIYDESGQNVAQSPTYSLSAGDYIGGWHKMRIEIDSSRKVKFYMDENLIAAPDAILNSTVLSNQKFVIGSRSSGSAGKNYQDNIKIWGEK